MVKRKLATQPLVVHQKVDTLFGTQKVTLASETTRKATSSESAATWQLPSVETARNWKIRENDGKELDSIRP